ncbi:MAG: hypothetical protein QOF99_7229, partial [Pseudonocardiales bacterium]|nr:hypothetical protein [Pseudonocardiales bacterium]
MSSQPMPPRFLNLDDVLSRELLLPRVDGLVRRANPMDWTSTAATAAVLTVGALGAITVVAQAIATGAPPIPFPVALGTVPGADPAPGARLPAIEVLSPGQRLNFGTMRVSTGSGQGSQFSRAALDTRDQPGNKAADYHQWSAPRLPDGPRGSGGHATGRPVHQSSGQHQGRSGGRHAGGDGSGATRGHHRSGPPTQHAGGGRHRANP